MKNWGRFEIVGTPSDADLIVEVRLNQEFTGYVFALPRLALRILDAKTHFVLWTLTETVKYPAKRETWYMNLDQAMTKSIGDMQALSDPATGGANQ